VLLRKKKKTSPAELAAGTAGEMGAWPSDICPLDLALVYITGRT
jgi:hypothetical protein